MARLLLDAGAKLTPTPFLLHYAILHRHAEMVLLLLEAGAMVNIRDDHGSTPLIVAAVTAQPSIIRLLLKHGNHKQQSELSPFSKLFIATYLHKCYIPNCV